MMDLAAQIAEADATYGEGAWALVSQTGSRSPRTCGERLIRLGLFCGLYGVRPVDCEVWRQSHVGEWLDRRSSREIGPPVAYLGGTHTYRRPGGGWRDFVISIRDEVWEGLIAADPSRAGWYDTRMR